MAEPRLYALPPGADFPAELVAGLIERFADRPPEALARVTLYLNTGRMLRAVRAAFDRQGARLLPRMRLVTDLGRASLPGLGPAVPALRRRLELAQLVTGLVRHRPEFAAGQGVIALAESLQRLLAEMQGEGVAPATLERLDIADHAEHWQRALAFLRIVAPFFDDTAEPDAETRQRIALARLAAEWAENPPADPVIVAGSTGSRGSTQMLLRAVAGLPAGTVVLPGFDFDLPAAVWDTLDAGPYPAEDHPQYRFLALCKGLDLAPGAVQRWRFAAEHAAGRNALVSLSLRPAPVTDQWLAEGGRLGDLTAATAGLTLIEAPDPRAEALAIAYRLRQAAEDGVEAQLITPDRLLARRVTAALDRWGIVPDDSGGLPLILSAPGRFLRHVAEAMARPLTLETLLTLLKHPLTATGAGDRGPHLRLTRELELRFRRHGPVFPDAAGFRAFGLRMEGAEDWAEWLAQTLGDAVLVGERPLPDQVAAHLALAGALAAGPAGSEADSQLWRSAAGAEARKAMEALAREAPHGGPITAEDYAALLAGVLDAGQVREPVVPHALIAIRGTLEARTGGAALTILGGLSDGVWPELPPPDPWLSRRMRAEAGLLLPERQVGLSAHDFQQAIAAPEAIVSRAKRDAEAETVPSRWLNRLVNLLEGLPAQGGRAALSAMRERGAALVAAALALEAPGAAEIAPPAPRPAPCPPLEDRPRELAVTGIRTLIRDPYAIYARHILGLKPLDPVAAVPDARERGQALHLIVERFVRGRPADEPLAAAKARLLALADEVLAAEIAWPAARRLWRARLARIAERFVRAEAQRAARGTPVVLESPGKVVLAAPVFTLTARPDRIDRLHDGKLQIFDYKSGTPPSAKQQEHFDKQLLLEAAMAERGGFDTLGPSEVAEVTYVGLGSGMPVVATVIDDAILGRTWEGLTRLIGAYLAEGQGYTARRAMFRGVDASDYDHLSRFGEWDAGDEPVRIPVGE